MWNDLSPQWKTAFEEAWESFKAGSVPIGAAIFDQNGKLIVRDRNRANGSEVVNKRISHAETNCLKRLDTQGFDPYTVVLYTTMEPCPMCMGASVMSGVRRLRYAAHDPYCGMVRIKDTERYMIDKGLDYEFDGGGGMEFVQLTVQSCYELRGIVAHGRSGKVLDTFKALCPEAVTTAGILYSKKTLCKLAEDGADFGKVYDMIIAMNTR